MYKNTSPAFRGQDSVPMSNQGESNPAASQSRNTKSIALLIL